uniref:Zinc finger protein n=1 Tax=Ascaris lumbricoides TaxID=6252 RepID=A0A0M3HNU4_ASCLU
MATAANSLGSTRPSAQALSDGDTIIETNDSSHDCEINKEETIEKRMKIEIEEPTEGNDTESVSSESRPPSSSLLQSQPSVKSSNSDEAAIPCIFCDKMFSDVSSLQNHTIGDHMNLSTQPDNESSIPPAVIPLQNGNTSEDVTFVCQQCDATLSSFVAFGQHMRTHLATDHDQKCHLCNIGFSNSQRRLAHVVEHFTGNSTRMMCKECPTAAFFNQHQIRQHHLEAHLEILYRCAICQRIFNTQNRFQEHLGVHNEELVRYHCVACNMPFESHDLLTIHVQLIHDRQPSQLQCPASVSSNTESSVPLAETRRSSPTAVSECRPVKCSVCDICFENEDDLDFHRLNIHCKVPRADRCAECQLEIASVAQFLEHTRLHMRNEQSVTCVVCRQALRNEAQVHSHANFHLSDASTSSKNALAAKSDSESESRCNICYQVLPTAESLRLHVVEHSSNGECPYCMKAFPLVQSLLAHVESTHGDARAIFACQSCQRSFHFISELQHHKCAHSRLETPAGIFLTERILSTLRDVYSPLGQHSTTTRVPPAYQCPFCPKMFGSESALQGHSHVHSSRAYRCDLCTLSFSSSARLETHRRKHFSEKDFTCQICDLKFHKFTFDLFPIFNLFVLHHIAF